MKKEKNREQFEQYLASLTGSQRGRLEQFFTEFDSHCLMAKKQKQIMRADFEQALLYYAQNGVSLDTALSHLDIANLGGFYARPATEWYALDDAAKIYPISMGHGQMAMFRLSVYLKKPVVPQLLQMALTFSIRRFPGFATTLKKGFFWHYFDSVKRRFSVEEENGIPCRPISLSLSGSQSFRVVYYNNRISVDFFHALTDGMGGMTFLKVLCCEYLRLTGVTPEKDGSVWEVSAQPSAQEFENAFANIPHTDSAAGFVDKAAVQMSGKMAALAPCRVLHFKMSAAQLKQAAAKYNATVTVYMLALMYLAQRAATEEMRGDTSIQVPVNMRKYYPSRTVRNFALYCGVRLPLDAPCEMEYLTQQIAAQLQEKASKPALDKMITAADKLVNSLAAIPLKIKLPVAKAVSGFLGEKLFSNTLSNLGVVKLPPSCAAEVDSMDFVLGSSDTKRAACTLVTFGDVTTFSITKMTADPTFEDYMHRLLTQAGVEITAEGSTLYAD